MAWAPVFHVLLEELDTGGWATLEAGDPELENGRCKPWKRGRGPTARGTTAAVVTASGPYSTPALPAAVVSVPLGVISHFRPLNPFGLG
ncbi:hypothetical protein CSOJ01_01443 [Colletotrichum sojae]|uniref:Uncharacterized protein n=1 Tax=Colletotrichum sojae TaxID=2175907 RepID=A0A8H6JVD1_9PEZI|nr:hypothetical protein CSOJ01_01443 [Colletotrichum sojae]